MMCQARGKCFYFMLTVTKIVFVTLASKLIQKLINSNSNCTNVKSKIKLYKFIQHLKNARIKYTKRNAKIDIT